MRRSGREHSKNRLSTKQNRVWQRFVSFFFQYFCNRTGFLYFLGSNRGKVKVAADRNKLIEEACFFNCLKNWFLAGKLASWLFAGG